MKRMLLAITMLLALTFMSHAWHWQEQRLAELGYSGTPENIVRVIAGRSCVASDGDVLKFETPEAEPNFEHTGHARATYRAGYATLLITRNDEVHSHIVTVAPENRILYFSAGKYQC